MNLWIKFGTHSARYMRVVKKRKPPAVGTQITVFLDEHSTKKQRVLIREIRQVGCKDLYCVELW